MKWIELTKDSDIEDIRLLSHHKPQVIFKHSTRCNISHLAKSRLERGSEPEGITFHLLDLIRFRNLSNRIADEFQVPHESPQVLLIQNGKCVFEESHNGIDIDEITEQAKLHGV